MGDGKLSRRALLRGMGLAGIAVALPWLELMEPSRRASAQSLPPPKRFVFFHWPNGIDPYNGLPPGNDGDPLVLTPQMSALAPYQSDLNYIRGLSSRGPYAASSYGDTSHERRNASFLTGVPTVPDSAGGPSLDQLVTMQVPDTRFPSVVAAALSRGTVYNQTVFWGGRNKPVAFELSPLQLFNRLFAATSVMSSPRLVARTRSILDYVQADIAALQGQLGAADRARLDEHLSSVRRLERELSAPSVESPACNMPTAPDEGPDFMNPNYDPDIERRCRQLMKIQVLALKCDLTRVICFSMGSTNNPWVYGHLGLTATDHEISHLHGGSTPEEAAQSYQTMTHWKLAQFAYLLGLLKGTVDGAGTLLDSSVVIGASEISAGDSHSLLEIPVFVAGKVGGMQTGRLLRLPCGGTVDYEDHWDTGCADPGSPPPTPVCNVWLAALRAMGSSARQFGDSTGVLPGLWGARDVPRP